MSSNYKILNMIGFIFLSYRRQVQKELSLYHVTFQQQRILKHLAGKDHLFPSEIAELLFCDRPTASVVIRNIEKKKWIKKERDSDNGKLVRISITEEGLKKFYELEKAVKSLSVSNFDPAKCFNKDEQKQFELLLVKYWNHIK